MLSQFTYCYYYYSFGVIAVMILLEILKGSLQNITSLLIRPQAPVDQLGLDFEIPPTVYDVT